LAAQAGRPYIHLPTHQRMEDNAPNLAEKDGVADGPFPRYIYRFSYMKT